MGPLPSLPGPARTAKLRARAPPLTARQQSGQAVLEGSAASSVAWPGMLTASLPSRTVVLMAPWSAVQVAALAAGLRAPLPLRAATWSTAPPLPPMGPLSTDPAVLVKGWFVAPRAPLLSMTGLWTRRIRPLPMRLTVPEHLLAGPR
ncbi:MAG TPA: hypothetical protein VFE41_06490 [Acetobacteraceae bacterium]|nr:hypothetical protein [Acetobacteraceae bacterium]